MIDPNELLLATMGVTPIINNEVPAITIGRMKEAREIPEKITELAKSMVSGGLKYVSPPRNHSYPKLLGRLTQPMEPNEIDKIVNAFTDEEHDLSGSFAAFCQHAYQAVQSIFPVQVMQNYAGPKNLTPPDDKIFSFFNQLQLLDNPLTALPLISTGAMLRTQANACRSLYPTLSQFVDSAIDDAIIETKADNEDYQVPQRIERGVSVWQGKRYLPFKLPEPPQQNPKLPTPKSASKDLETQSQRVSNS